MADVRDADLEGATVLSVARHRWDVHIRFRLVDGTERTMVASADAFYTERDGIWWDTEEETRAWTG